MELSEYLDQTKADGWKKIIGTVAGALIIGGIAIVNKYFPGITGNVDAQNFGSMVSELTVGAVTGIYTLAQAYHDGKKAEAAATVIAAEKAAAAPAPPQLIDNPDYGKFQPAQIAAFKQPVPQPQLVPDRPNTVTRALDAMTAKVSDDQGAFDFLMEELGRTIDRQYKFYVDAAMSTLDAIKKVVAEYLGVDLTPQDCQAVAANVNLATILHSYADKTVLASIWSARKAGTLSAACWAGIMGQAYRRARQNVIEAFQSAVYDARDQAARASAMACFGLNEYTQKTCVPSGQGILWINLHGGMVPFNGYTLVGVDPASLKPVE